MDECPICFESSNMVSLRCNHSFCQICLDRWLSSCPLCRENILRNPISQSDFSNIDINIESPKGTSLPISNYEKNIIREIFGSFRNKTLEQLSLTNNILVQNYIGNCWWVGKISKIEGNFLDLENTVFIKRNSGAMFNASPSTRTIEIMDRDSLYVLL